MRVGEIQTLTVNRLSDDGLYLADEEGNEALLPNRYVSLSQKVGDSVEFGGLLGSGPIMSVNLTKSPKKFIDRAGRIPAPMQSLKN